MTRNIFISLVFALLASTALAQQAGPGTGPGDGTGYGPGDGTHPAPADGTGFGAGMGGGPGFGPVGSGSFQAGPGNCQMSDPGQQMTERLGLDETQAGQVAAIMEEARLQRDAIREAAREEICATRLDVETAMAAVLTAEQFELWLSLRNENELRRAYHGRLGPFDPGFSCDLEPAASDGS
jgi:Spy/CpxP family protein refolding chaperone